MVLGIPDFWIWSAYLLCILSALLCIVYGIVNWNKGANVDESQIKEEKTWEEKDPELKENL